jgi:hypothetical protein
MATKHFQTLLQRRPALRRNFSRDHLQPPASQGAVFIGIGSTLDQYSQTPSRRTSSVAPTARDHDRKADFTVLIRPTSSKPVSDELPIHRLTLPH